ncbi:MAG: hypothetical protein ACOH2K_05230 [Burkholderiaceae bacterium]
MLRHELTAIDLLLFYGLDFFLGWRLVRRQRANGRTQINLYIETALFNIRDIPKEKIQLDRFIHDEQIVTMIIDRCLEYQIIDNFGTDCYEITENNHIKIELPYTNYEFVIQLILSFGDKVEVLSLNNIINDLKIHA